MKRPLALATYLLFFFVGFGCDETTNSPQDTLVDPNFKLSRLALDSLYPDETGTLLGKGFGIDAKQLKLYCGSIPLAITQAQDSSIDFILPTQVESGVLRWYKNDRQATGDIFLTVLPRGLHTAARIDGFVPEYGYAGEALVVYGDHLQMRIRDARIRIGKKELKIDSTTKFAIYARIPDDVNDDTVHVAIEGKEQAIGSFHKIERGGDHILFSSSFKQVTLRISVPVVCRRTDNDVEVSDDFKFTAFDTLVHAVNAQINFDGQTVHYAGESVKGSDTTVFDLDLTELSEDRVEGSLIARVARVSFPSTWNHVEMRFKISGALCRSRNGITELTASAFNDPEAIVLRSYEATDYGAGWSSTVSLKEVLPLIQGLEPSFISLEFR